MNLESSERILSVLSTTLDAVMDSKISSGYDVQSCDTVEISARFFINTLMRHVLRAFSPGETDGMKNDIKIFLSSLEKDVYSNLKAITHHDS